MSDYRCDIPGCRYVWSGPKFVRFEVIKRHVVKRHEAVAEATAVTAGLVLPAARREREIGCSCPEEIFDPDCGLHAFDASY